VAHHDYRVGEVKLGITGQGQEGDQINVPRGEVRHKSEKAGEKRYRMLKGKKNEIPWPQFQTWGVLKATIGKK